eukprot:4698182-Prymnesium_polylepis.1
MRLQALAEPGEDAVRRVLRLVDIDNYTVVALVPSQLPTLCTTTAAACHESMLRCMSTQLTAP